MKKLILSLVIILGFSSFAQSQRAEGIYLDQNQDTLTMVSDTGHEITIKLSEISPEEGQLAIIDDEIVLINGQGDIIDSIPVTIVDSEESYSGTLTGNLEVDIRNIETQNQNIDFNINEKDVRDYTRQKLFEIGGIPVYSKGLELNNN